MESRKEKFDTEPFTLQWWVFVQSKIIKMAFEESWLNMQNGLEPWQSKRYKKLQEMARYIGIRIMNDYKKK